MNDFTFEPQDTLPPDLAAARILVVDDNPANLMVLANLLDEAGYTQVETESSSPQAVKRWLAAPFDLLLLDIRMPELDGHAVMQLLKKHLAADDYLPCIVLTAQTDRETREAALDAGAVDFITKPFDFEDTLKRIRNALRTRLLHQTARREAKNLAQTVGAQQAELQAKEDDLAYLARHDALTGLLNRRAFNERLQELGATESGGFTLSLIEITDADQLLLLDGIESVDLLLKTVTSRLQLLVSDHFGLCGIWSGQTFVCVLPLAGDAVAPVLDKMMRQVFAPLSHDSFQLTLHGRGGYAEVVTPAGSTPNEFLWQQAIQSAGFALASQHKRSNRIARFDQVLAESYLRRSQVERALFYALEHDPSQFALHFQPKIDLKQEQPVGCEALLRWRHPELGWISPAEFIPIAEEKGYIEELGLIVIDQAAAFIARMLRETGTAVSVAVNVSSYQFELIRARGGSLVDEIETILQRHAVAPQWLEIEITESALLSGFDWVIEKLQRLRALGISIALDDFGTGYSSLSYLQRLPITTLKIDRSFVDNAANLPRQAAMLGSIVRMADELGLTTVAEGVETLADLAILKNLNCSIAQGYYYSRPLPSDAFIEWLRQFPRPTDS
ncbi:putative bifunctional diguanylate cyclase/phosphodiesterase [Halothiobacillus sp. DCM-1]|uniref:putative bifunctional diguanylate cyclase/phosphodiesterase n=1 Tax=Halothiobacillus sp. DCM-1 TaxID=3112558 RepID=UPI003244AECE